MTARALFRLFACLVLAAALGCKSKNRFIGNPPPSPVASVGNVSGTGALFLWSTDNPATSWVEYGTTFNYTHAVGTDSSLVRSHEVQLTSLAPSTLYHYRTRSRDEAGNTIYGFDKTFTTPAAGVVVPLSGVFDFESGITGWVRQDYVDSQAAVSVESSAAAARSGAQSLKVNLTLIGGHATLSKGEAFVSFGSATPFGTTMDFMDLTNRTISCWIFAPTGSMGDPSNKNGVQVFAKDTAGKSKYSNFINITENTWFQVSMVAGGAVLAGEYADTGFDPARISLVGVKIGAGGASVATYNGPVYVDDYAF